MNGLSRGLLSGAVLIGLTFGANATELTVQLTGISDGRGDVLVIACDETGYAAEITGRSATPACTARQVRAAAAGDVTVVLGSLPPGRYAIRAFHDHDRDGRLGRGIFGVPTEGFGFSNNPDTTFGPPDFAAAAVEISRPTRLSIRLRYPLGAP
ncbi:MAG: DUF2141 domain-containing protein [Alphaproteobacteria bacterium]|nr:MAG: DUF2141 domain-containing protein [Alphaproteobacteria bacterium]